MLAWILGRDLKRAASAAMLKASWDEERKDNRHVFGRIARLSAAWMAGGYIDLNRPARRVPNIKHD